MPNEEPTNNEQRRVVSAQLHYVNNEREPFLYANQIFLRRLPDSVVVSFAVSHGPFELEPDTEKVEREGVPAYIVAKIAVSNQRFPAFAKVMMQIAESLERGEPSDEYGNPESERPSSDDS